MENKTISLHNTMQRKYRYWMTLRDLSEEHKLLNSTNSFVEWVNHCYGFEILFADNGYYSADHIITNPSKYMFFQLKYNII